MIQGLTLQEGEINGCGSIAGNETKEIEQETGKPVITSKNSIDLGKLIGVVAKEIENEEEKKMIVTNLSFKEKNMKKFISNKCQGWAFE